MLISIKTVTGDRIDYHTDDEKEMFRLITNNPNGWCTVSYEKGGQKRVKYIHISHIVSVTVTDES